jgi:hypothetical protein
LSVVVPGSAQVMSTRAAVLHVAGHTGVDVLI